MTAERLPPLLALAARYEILREVGRGGTSVVYLARDRETDAEVAIKLIHARYADDAEAVARFAREARFVAQLEHPNIVRVHEVIHLDDGAVALVMAHVAGRTLKQRIAAAGPLSPAETERIMRDVAAALGAVNARGLVHRDVKPENIFLDEEGRALLADFGVARSMSDTQQLTMHGVAIGTPTYMAPEQIDGLELDGRGDIYSLGLVAWEMLVGHRPWEGEALYSVLYHQKHVRLPAVTTLRDDVPPHLAEAIAGAIEKERECRWQTVDELIAALDGHAPPRRAPTVAPLGNETIQFVREPALATTATTALMTTAAATMVPRAPIGSGPVAAIRAARDRMPPSTRVVLAGALVSLIALVLVAGGVQAWADGAARRGRQAPATVARQGVSAGVVAVRRDSVGRPSAVTGAAGGGDGPAGVAIPAALPAQTPSAPLAPARGGDSAPVTARATTPVMVAPTAPPAAAPAPLPVIVPSRPAAVTPRVRVVTGGRHTCLLTADGRTFCWGGNDRGQLGVGTGSRASTPTALAADKKFASVAPGLAHSCAIDDDGGAWCWGENDRGQLGDGTTSAHDTPTRVADNHRFRVIAAGASHTCGLDIYGAAWCWGANGFGQLGDTQARDRSAPVAVASSRRFVALSAGWNFTCALDDDGRATCWGDDGAGQLGDGGSSARRAPTSVQGRLAFASISAGNAHACGITVGGEAYCWGANASGQLGDGTTSDRTSPTRVGGDARFVSIQAGAVHTCALTAEGEAFCWGRNTYGQLGDGGTEDHPSPVRVAGGHAFAAIRAFGSHTCATTTSSEVFCWGYNLDGQLGDGTRTHRTRPVYVERPGGR